MNVKSAGVNNSPQAEGGYHDEKASIRCKVEHVFRIVKRQFGYSKTAYRGLQKNANRLYVLFLSSNLYMLARAGRSLRKLETA